MTGQSSSRFLPWDRAFDAGPLTAGGKGWNLGRLHRYGYTVPRGGVLPAHAYREFLSHNRLEPLIRESPGVLRFDNLSDSHALDMLGKLHSAIAAGVVPPRMRIELEQALDGAGLLQASLAVRSSATCEDSPQASFAGIHDSYLNVSGIDHVIDAVKQCYASLWTERAVAYRGEWRFPTMRWRRLSSSWKWSRPGQRVLLSRAILGPAIERKWSSTQIPVSASRW